MRGQIKLPEDFTKERVISEREIGSRTTVSPLPGERMKKKASLNT